MNEPGTPSLKAIRKAQRELHTQRERVNENERLVAAVFQALRQTRTPGLRYATIRKADGVSFSHLVAHGEADGRNALTHLPRRENAAPFQKAKALQDDLKKFAKSLPDYRTTLTDVEGDCSDYRQLVAASDFKLSKANTDEEKIINTVLFMLTKCVDDIALGSKSPRIVATKLLAVLEGGDDLSAF